MLGEVIIPRHEAEEQAEQQQQQLDGHQQQQLDGQQQQQADGSRHSVSIAWRGDGKYFATCSGAPGRRRVHIWDREAGCALHAAAEAPPGRLLAPAAWQPNCRHLYVAADCSAAEAAAAREEIAGAFAAAAEARLRAAGASALAAAAAPDAEPAAAPLAAAAASDPQRRVRRVLLFERNGLAHGGFDLPECAPGGGGGGSGGDAATVRDLAWSPDSEILAVVLGPPPPAADEDSGDGGGAAAAAAGGWRVQLWRRSNWHWYMKQELPFPLLPPGGRVSVAWDEARAGRLVVVTSAGGVLRAALGWAACVSARGTAAVIDGCDVLLTPFRCAVLLMGGHNHSWFAPGLAGGEALKSK